jgi:hypothetical protein
MRAVTLVEFGVWFKKHENRTWSFEAKHPSYGIKYFQLQFDTRTGDVFFIRAYQGTIEEGTAVHVGDDIEGAKTVLDGLETKLGWGNKK